MIHPKDERHCENCGYIDTYYCAICEDFNFHKTKEEKDAIEYMCDLMCGKEERDN